LIRQNEKLVSFHAFLKNSNTPYILGSSPTWAWLFAASSLNLTDTDIHASGSWYHQSNIDLELHFTQVLEGCGLDGKQLDNWTNNWTIALIWRI
jgi:hypothetical protein